MKATSPFTAHPASVGETYGEHLAVAGGFGGRLMLAGLACLIHGLFPFLFVKTGSRAVAELHQRMVTGRTRPERQPGPVSSLVSAKDEA